MSTSQKIQITPIGFVKRSSTDEYERDRSLISKIVVKNELAKGLDGIEGWSHVYVIFWMDKISDKEKMLVYPGGGNKIGILATRAPIHPNPIGLTLVELVKHEQNILWVRGLDALNGTPVLDIKPYPDWEKGHWIVLTDFRAPGWFMEINK